LNDVDKLFLDKVEHRSSLFEEEGITYRLSGQFAWSVISLILYNYNVIRY